MDSTRPSARKPSTLCAPPPAAARAPEPMIAQRPAAPTPIRPATPFPARAPVPLESPQLVEDARELARVARPSPSSKPPSAPSRAARSSARPSTRCSPTACPARQSWSWARRRAPTRTGWASRRRRERPAHGPHVRRHRHERERDLYITNIYSGGPPATAHRPWPSRRFASLSRAAISNWLGPSAGAGGGTAAKAVLDTTRHHADARQMDPRAPRRRQRGADAPTFHPAYLLRTPASKRQSWLDLLALDRS